MGWPGLAYVLSYIATYDETHDVGTFAGNLVLVHQQFSGSSTDEKEKLEKQFDKIMEGLAMPNGVQKMTRRLRQHSILAKVLADERCRPQKSAITVLDVPSSSGVAALDSIEMLRQYYTIRAYVLGDLCFHIHYDTARECVFDEDFNLLQVGLGKRFFSIHRGHRSGDVYTPLTGALLFPLDDASRSWSSEAYGQIGPQAAISAGLSMKTRAQSSSAPRIHTLSLARFRFVSYARRILSSVRGSNHSRSRKERLVTSSRR